MSDFEELQQAERLGIAKIQRLRKLVRNAIDLVYEIDRDVISEKAYDECHKVLEKLPYQACYRDETQEVINGILERDEIERLERRLQILKGV